MDWGAINEDDWRDVPHVTGRLATEDDVREGRAVFYLDGAEGAQPGQVPIPSLALLRDEDGNGTTTVVVIQAEIFRDECTVGYRPLEGGNGICLLEEITLLPRDPS